MKASLAQENRNFFHVDKSISSPLVGAALALIHLAHAPLVPGSAGGIEVQGKGEKRGKGGIFAFARENKWMWNSGLDGTCDLCLDRERGFPASKMEMS